MGTFARFVSKLGLVTACTAACLAAPRVDGSHRFVLERGDPVDMIDGGTFGNFWGESSLTPSGMLAFAAGVRGAGEAMDWSPSFWAVDPSTGAQLRLAAHYQPIAAFPTGLTVISRITPQYSDSLSFAYLARVQGPGVTQENDRLVVSATSEGEMTVLAREGDPAPGVADGSISTGLFDLKMARSGHFSFRSFLPGMNVDGTFKIGLWLKPPDAPLIPLAIPDTQVPNRPAGQVWNVGAELDFARDGSFVLDASVRGVGVSPSAQDGREHWLWRGTGDGNLAPVLRADQLPAYNGVKFDRFLDTRISDDGWISFVAVADTGFNEYHRAVFEVSPGGAPRKVLAEGDLGPPPSFPANGVSYVVSSNGLMGLRAGTQGIPTIYSRSRDGDLHAVIARDQTLTLDFGSGDTCRRLRGYSLRDINSLGQMAIEATLRNCSNSNEVKALLLYSPAAGWEVIAADNMLVGEGDTRLIDSWYYLGLNDLGQIAHGAILSDGSWALTVTTVPEPGGGLAAVAGMVMILGRRR